MIEFIEKYTQTQIIPSLAEFIKIPNQSPQFDSQWKQNEYLEQACNHIYNWIIQETKEINSKTQLLSIVDAPKVIVTNFIGTFPTQNTILFYGHYDKQPPFTGWKDKFGPYTPILENGRLYGRGSADDGCVPYCLVNAIKCIIDQKKTYHNCILIIEGEEESGSLHLLDYIKMLSIERIDLMIAIDSGIIDYDRLWITNSMRGAITFDLTIKKEYQAFNYLRQLLDKLENSQNGKIHEDFQVIIPVNSYKECLETANLVPLNFPMMCNKMEKNHVQQYLNRSWNPSISYLGGLENLDENSKEISLRISMRLPPSKCALQASQSLNNLLSSPYSQINILQAKSGLVVKEFSKDFRDMLNNSSLEYFNKEAKMFHEGASIPFLKQLQDLYPESNFLILGVLASDSNAHGPNENLNINYFNKLCGCISNILSN